MCSTRSTAPRVSFGRGLSDLYLTKPGSLRASYETGARPPRKDSIVKLAGALAQLPVCDQLKRVDSIREHGVNLISLIETEDDFVEDGTVISLQDWINFVHYSM